jgi:hypothetical protein
VVELVQVDIGQQRGQWASLGTPFLRWHYDSVFHHPTLQESLDELYYPLIVNFSSKQIQQFLVVQRVKVLGQIQ